MSEIVLITDTKPGSAKMLAIQAVISPIDTRYEPPLNNAVPKSIDAFLPVVEGRLQKLKTGVTPPKNSGVVFATMQHGFYKIGNIWYMNTIVLVERNGKQVSSFGKEIALSEKITDRMMELPDEARYQEFETVYPDFKTSSLVEKASSAYTEKDWLEYAVKSVYSLL